MMRHQPTLRLLPVRSSLADKADDARALDAVVQALGTPCELVASAQDADGILVCTGGTERYILDHLAAGAPRVLLAGPEANAFAASVEVAGRQRMRREPVLLEPVVDGNGDRIRDAIAAARAVRTLRGQRLGLIGEPSPWLVASTPDLAALEARLGVIVEQVGWDDIDVDLDAPGAASSWDEAARSSDEVDAHALKHAVVLSQALEGVIAERAWDATTVECFSLLRSQRTTGCLALADSNERGVPAACEGDICSALGMMLVRAASGPDAPPSWMANLTFAQDRRLWLSHCTIAPSCVGEVELRSHYESGIGVAIRGDFEAGARVSVLRIGADLETAWLHAGRVAASEARACRCRTQIVVDLDDDPAPLLGNHHIVMLGDHTHLLARALGLLGLRLVAR